jgi:hypothetical protein
MTEDQPEYDGSAKSVKPISVTDELVAQIGRVQFLLEELKEESIRNESAPSIEDIPGCWDRPLHWAVMDELVVSKCPRCTNQRRQSCTNYDNTVHRIQQKVAKERSRVVDLRHDVELAKGRRNGK